MIRCKVEWVHFPSYWPEKSRGRWRRQSRSRQSHFHNRSPQSLRAYRRGGCWGTPAWSRATPRPWRSWGANTRRQKVNNRGFDNLACSEQNVGYLKRRVKAWKKVWKLLWWFIAFSSMSSMFPNTWGSRREGASRPTTAFTDRFDHHNTPLAPAILRSNTRHL